MTDSRKLRGRPVEYLLPDLMPDSPENIARAILGIPPRKREGWKHVKEDALARDVARLRERMAGSRVGADRNGGRRLKNSPPRREVDVALADCQGGWPDMGRRKEAWERYGLRGGPPPTERQLRQRLAAAEAEADDLAAMEPCERCGEPWAECLAFYGSDSGEACEVP